MILYHAFTIVITVELGSRNSDTICNRFKSSSSFIISNIPCNRNNDIYFDSLLLQVLMPVNQFRYLLVNSHWRGVEKAKYVQ